MCKEIATLHGTELSFESEKGNGTTVSFTLKKGGEEDESSKENKCVSIIVNYDCYESKLEIDTSKYYYSNESVQKNDMKEYNTEFGILQIPTDIKEN